ncbi:hypothetical protein [Deinococcus arenicola]|uniref:Uncharacterized protein n=1 Tax=Deinococcus arenicola TaxID=2994950 RepID=A0ABU4DVA8_9DEIO|nr:hypothetical protein [Deinococcus sp. ZS9-10]MDV6376371.1 hypothetical protein [Deinococcus sp. ZS9-10]
MEISTSTPTPSTASEPRTPVEQLAAASAHPAYLIAAATAAQRWLPGQELTTAQFNTAVQEAAGSVIK